MIGIDTNILIRMFQTEDDPRQSAAAQNFVRHQAPVFLSPIVLAQFAWTLRNTFKIDRIGIYARLAILIDAPEFAVPYPEAVALAVKQYGKGSADFADYLIGELNLAYGCDRTFTFDKDAVRNNRAFQILKT
jgi:predicted nucleic-acid-binding protein